MEYCCLGNQEHGFCQHEADKALVGCPNCPDQGWYIGGTYEGIEQIQCEFCYTVENSIFYVTNNLGHKEGA